MTSNGTSLNDGILHAHRLERYKTAEVVAVQKLLAQADAELRVMIARSGNLSAWTQARLARLLKDIAAVTAEHQAAVEKVLKGDLKDYAAIEAAWQAGELGKVLPMDWETTRPAAAQIMAAALDRPFDGIILEDALAGIGAGRQKRIDQVIRRDTVLGKTTDEIVRDLFGTKAANYRDGIMPSFTRKDVQSIVRTAVAHVSSAAREMTYQANDDIVKGVQWVATLDPETCEVCMGLDGKVYDIGEEQFPPAHYNCRCTTVPVLKSWREMGLDIDELPPGSRASLDGQVPETMRYGDWLKAQPEAIQREALGPSRYELFASGKSINAFAVDGRILTLDELKGAA